MKTYTDEEIKLIVEKHGKWRRGEEGGARADLTGADLTGANLTGPCIRHEERPYKEGQ
jgi:hypothetical protein